MLKLSNDYFGEICLIIALPRHEPYPDSSTVEPRVLKAARRCNTAEASARQHRCSGHSAKVRVMSLCQGVITRMAMLQSSDGCCIVLSRVVSAIDRQVRRSRPGVIL